MIHNILHYIIHSTGRSRAYKSHHLLCCQMLRCQDRCPHCPLFQDGGQNGFGTSLTQLVSATPCQRTELYVFKNGKQKQKSISTNSGLTHGLCTFLQGVHLPAGLGSKYLCDVVIP